MTPSLSTYLIALPAVFLAAVVDAIGGGGGLISLPAYQLAGLDYDLASGTNKFSAMFGSLTATIKYARSGHILWKQGIIAACGAIPAAFLGVRVVTGLDENVKNIFMLVAIPLMTVVLLLRRNKNTEAKPQTNLRLLGCLATGLLIGFYDGFFGPGTGTLMILLFTWLGGMDYVHASGTAKLVNLSSNLAALTGWIGNGTVLFALAIPATCLSIAGGYLGSYIALKRGAKVIRFVMLFVLLLLIGKLAWNFFAA